MGERHVGQDLRRAAQDRRLRVHARIAGHHADVLRPEVATERQELLVHQRLDRACVNRALARTQRLEVKRGRHKRFARTGRRAEDHIVPREQFEHRLLLFGIRLETACRHHGEKPVEHRVQIRRSGERRQRRKRDGRRGHHSHKGATAEMTQA